MKKQAFNPYLPSWEYIPDGEPYVFGDRVYVYGSHDKFNGHVFCLGSYMGWSAPVDDLGDWRCEGVTYPRNGDPLNADGHESLFAPDVTVGPDGRYYMYYVLNHEDIVSVAVCDTPAGRYHFYGYVHYKDGTRLGARPGDEPQFDPGVLTENGKTYLYTGGFCGMWEKTRHGGMLTVLGEDMVTIEEDPIFVCPSANHAAGTSFAEHPFGEAPSIRKRGDTYYYIYSSALMHELCYATAKDPRGPFQFRGRVVSNCDIGIDSYKPADMSTSTHGNNHGSIVEIKGQWYVFYHRQTNGNMYSRQGCMEPISFREDGSIIQPEITSCGGNGGPLRGEGEYPSYICCNLFTVDDPNPDPARRRFPMPTPKITQDGADDDKEPCYVTNIRNNTYIGFKYFDCQGVKKFAIETRGYGKGEFQIKTAWDGEVLATIPIEFTDLWTRYETDVAIPDGKQAIYLCYVGGGSTALKCISFGK